MNIDENNKLYRVIEENLEKNLYPIFKKEIVSSDEWYNLCRNVLNDNEDEELIKFARVYAQLDIREIQQEIMNIFPYKGKINITIKFIYY